MFSLIERLSRYAGWAIVLAAGILSVVPGGLRPQTGLPHSSDHLVAYFAIAALLAVGHARRVSPGVVAFLLILAAVGFEAVQYFVPGRRAGLLDIAASSAGAIGGAFAAYLILRLVRGLAGLDRDPQK